MSGFNGSTQPSGSLGLQVTRKQHLPVGVPTIRQLISLGLLPKRELHPEARSFKRRNALHYMRGLVPVLLARMLGLPTYYGTLALRVVRANGEVIDYGIVGHKVVTTAGVTKIVDFLRNNDVSTGATFKFHGIGTGSTAEATGDTALVTELTTEYNPNSTRPTGSQTNNTAVVYESVGTITVDQTPGAAIREHGLFSAAAVASGTLLDRTVFAAITLSSGDSIQATYDLTVAAGG